MILTEAFQLLSFTTFVVAVLSQTVDEQVRAYLEDSGGYNERATTLSKTYTTELSLQWSEFAKNESVKASEFDLNAITDASLKRQIEKILDVGISGYEDTSVLNKIADLEAEMTDIYSAAEWCKSQGECYKLEPGLTEIITNSRNYDELLAAWKGWRDVSGKHMRAKYQEFVELMNMAIKAGERYSDMGDYYRSWYEDPQFETDVRNLFDELAPLYDQLHIYVRRKLKEHYGANKFPTSGHIPAHLFGNMWAQGWSNIFDLLAPYPEADQTNLTKAMIDQNYNVTHMYEMAEEFFTSIRLKKMPDTFWTHSMLERPPDRDVVCHASAWDMNNGTDFRIKQCTIVTGDQFNTVHHEMGHVQYYLEYINQPYLYRSGANPGFHEGVADIAKGDINFLFQMALRKVAFLPFGYLIDQWRWSVYRGQTTPANYNTEWWKLREMLQMGSSKQWGEALFTLTRGTSGETRKLSAAPLLSYFKPLQEWLTQRNAEASDTEIWDKTSCPPGSFRTTSGGNVVTPGNLLLVLLITVIFAINKV
ncbi:ACE-like protein [Mya arenaria]|uniref:Angiotensin-converting enzyme n=1 Tax=Mya arenaria TaxID=6604 RepID=A0ABY7E8R0_MYAAR|nr:ACE-like protein [Mya arenaria]